MRISAWSADGFSSGLSEAALFIATGFAANAALFATLPQRGDLIVHDELIHASAHDGMKLGRAERAAAAHNDAQAFDDAIAAWRKAGGTGTPWIAVESLYSMDGDTAPLRSEEHTSDLQSLMRISYAVFCLKKKNN